VLVGVPIDTGYLKQRISEVLEAISELKRLTSKPYSKLSQEEKYSIRYHVIVLAESVGGICVHVATEDFRREPLSYSECFKMLEDKGVFDCAKDLIGIMRLRNLLVHRYWTIEDSQVYDSIKKNFRGVHKFLGSMKRKYGINL